MSAETLLSRLDGVKRNGVGRWMAKCPAHEDRSASLSVRETEDGRVLLHDFGGCSTDAVLSSLGLEMAALFPERPEFAEPRTRSAPRIPAADILRAVAHEVHVAACAASELAAGRPLSPEDLDCLSLCVRRLSAASEVANG